MENSYNPYSNFFVGAALLTDNGKIITGTNFENAAYTSVCAERTAIIKANSMGYTAFKSIAVITRVKDSDTKEPSASCGFCRQYLYEAHRVAGHDIEIILSNTKKDKIIITSIKELLPLGFGPADLGIDVKRFRK